MAKSNEHVIYLGQVKDSHLFWLMHLIFLPPRCGVVVCGQHQGQLLGEQQAASAWGAVERGRLHLLPVCGWRSTLHGHGLQTELPKSCEDPRRVLPILRRYLKVIPSKFLRYLLSQIGSKNRNELAINLAHPMQGVHAAMQFGCRSHVDVGSLKGRPQSILQTAGFFVSLYYPCRQNDTHLCVRLPHALKAGGQHNWRALFSLLN